MFPQDLSFSSSLFKPLNPSFSLQLFSNPLRQNRLAFKPKRLIPRQILAFSGQDARPRDSVRCFAGRSKKKGGRIDGIEEISRERKRRARIKSKKLAESFFYRLNNPNKNYPNNFTEDELQAIGLGYDRMVRFMSKDDPNLRHPYDWYKYGEFGPYSWRGVVLGDPVRGRFSDERVCMIGEVKDQEEWEKIEQFDMEVDFGERLKKMDKDVGFRYFWVFVRHPKWRLNEKPWEQWTLVSEVVLEAGKQRLDKWSLMGRLGNQARQLITKCAAWMRPDIIYVKRPVYQCRFEPQDQFFRALTPFLDPETERDFLFELRNEDGSVEMCTYFGGLCRIVKVSQKAFVDDVVNAYEKLSEEKKSRCLEFLLTNHPVQLLHPWTREWKTKLEEMELGCDAPDEDEDEVWRNSNEKDITEWIEDDGDGDDDNEEEEIVMEMEEGEDEDNELEDDEDDELESEEEDPDPKEDVKYWEDEFKKSVSSSEAMENLARRSIERNSELFKKQMESMQGQENDKDADDGDETAMRGVRAKVSPQEWKTIGVGPWRKRIKKSRIPPELFLAAAVRPFTYRNLVKEIVLTRHAILDGDINTGTGRKD
ncbi:hypothetical protein HS088_TW21G00431 [Tripterygium wilfordii]|uniref:Uncharacterized protein n=1 Tax=Tripterygium wilfordii TaxID=458696 RepID=A0A7J7C3E9_TRIWF|nr:uncharacterized protein LOC119989298 [Tripterygium wilfordii]KAF5728286.1 hypothetical protein HS088_TW21G00431 [Tripterygium wilfordii]